MTSQPDKSSSRPTSGVVGIFVIPMILLVEGVALGILWNPWAFVVGAVSAFVWQWVVTR
ncbi:MAG TPA: hypothetical protein VG348_15830 [Acidimicrobiia bacterium]|jgi:hypothetical protein|nr:hypothetical protein [Acidimicrobiia bacterium]